MKCLIFATLIAAASAAGYIAPTFYNYGLPYATGYSYGYNTATPWSHAYSYSTVGATPYAAALPYAAAAAAPAALPYAAAPAVVAAPAPAPAAVAAYAPAFYSYDGQSQYRSQDAYGNVAFGYAGGPSSKNEVRRSDGVVQGSFSYVDGNGLVQSRSYVADALGFRVIGTDIPQGPAAPAVAVAAPAAAVVVKAAAPIPAPVAVVAVEGAPHVPVEGIDVPYKTPEVKAAEAAHFAAHAEALARSKREASPSGGRRPAPASARAVNQYPIRSVSVPAGPRRGPSPAVWGGKKGGKRVWKREASPEPKGKFLVKKGGYRHAPIRRLHPAPKKLVLLKKW